MEAKHNSTAITKCRCCEQTMEVYTIDDMLARAYAIIDKNPKLLELLSDLRLDKHSVGIAQEFSRLKALSSPYSDFLKDYRCIQGTESGIFLNYNENFTVLESIEVDSQVFWKMYIRGYKAQFKTYTNEEKLKFFEDAFAKFDSRLANLSSYIELEYNHDFIDIMIKLKNQHKNLTYVCYPNSNQYPYYSFDKFHDDTNYPKMIKVELASCEEIDEPISKWLHQSIINMYPDYGQTYLWFDGAGGSCGCIEGYELGESDLEKRLDDWQLDYECSWDKIDTDWDTFNQIGYKLYLELKEIIKKDYILTYNKGFAEVCGSHAEFKSV